MIEVRRDDKVYPSSVLVRVADFSRTPGARFRVDGPFSGEEFRQEYLEGHFEKDEEGNEQEHAVEVDLRGIDGYASSFLDEAFGGLVRKYSRDKLRGRLLSQCDGDMDVAREIANIMREADEDG